MKFITASTNAVSMTTSVLGMQHDSSAYTQPMWTGDTLGECTGWEVHWLANQKKLNKDCSHAHHSHPPNTNNRH